MIQLNTFEDVLMLGLAVLVAYAFFQYVNGFLSYHYGQGEREQRTEAIESIIGATTLVFVAVGIWVGYTFFFSLLA